jgi:hypothetical protein
MPGKAWQTMIRLISPAGIAFVLLFLMLGDHLLKHCRAAVSLAMALPLNGLYR